MRRFPVLLGLAPAALIGILVSPAGSADPVHRYFRRDGYWHHGSGWIFPTKVAGFVLGRSPSEIEGNNDVTAEYASDVNGVHRDAVLDVYYLTSAAVGAKLATARPDVQSRVASADCKIEAKEADYAIKGHPELKGVKITFTPEKADGCKQANLYFFHTNDWVISVRTSAAATDRDAAKAFEAFVREQLWDALGTDPLSHEPPPT